MSETLESFDNAHPARWWTRLDDGRFECQLCPRLCKLKPGQRGFCFVRAASDEGVVLTTWGRSSGFAIDPVEKKPLNHFLPGSAVLSFGTAGCNLGCRYCQNWDMSKAREMDLLQDQAGPEDIALAALRTNCESVAYTYNDPIIFAEYALDIAAACRARGVKNIAVTNGYISPEPRREFYDAMDAANIDLKGFTDGFYDKLCFAHLGPVLDTLEYVARETRCWLEVTTLLIPGHNDSDEEIDKLSQWVVDHLGPDVPLHFSAFFPTYKMTDVPRTPPATVKRARRIAMGNGLNYVYTGNIADPDGGSTWCPSCGELIIERRGYSVGRWALKDGACGACGRGVPGVFDDQPPRTVTRPHRIDLAAYGD